MKLRLSPSILSADFANLGNDITEAEKSLCSDDFLHIDVMDGVFVPSISFGFPIIESIRKQCNLTFDVHLMITEPIRYVERFVKAGADIITVHVEACKALKETLNAIKALGVKCAVSINPKTDAEVLRNYINDVDMILLMTVEPGFGGQKYIDAVTEKIKAVRRMITDSGRDIMLEVDGGIYSDNISTVIEAGADVIVCGSAIFKGNISDNIRELKAVFKGYE